MWKRVVSLCIILSSVSASAVTVHLKKSNVPLYEIVEIEFISSTAYTTPFKNPKVTTEFISPSGKKILVDGFYNGNNTYLIRFMSNEKGQWIFNWRFDQKTGMGFFICGEKENPRLHGHIKIDPGNNRKLCYEDGTPLHMVGGKYLCFLRPFGTEDLQNLSYPERLETVTYINYVKNYLDTIAEMGLNSVLLKIQVLPLNYDLQSMNLVFLRTADDIIRYAMNLGIVVQLNIFDTWGRRKEGVSWSSRNPSSVNDLLLEPWNPNSYVEATKFYLQYIIARYAAFPNVQWELWNEAERLDVSAYAATAAYMPWIKAYDPYDIPVGGSEMYTGHYPLDMTFPHASLKCYPWQWDFTHNKALQDPNGFNNGRPLYWNELKPGGNGTIEENYDWYRGTFWGNFTAGAIGSSDYCWADIRTVPNTITQYLGHYAKFVQSLINVNKLTPADDLAASQSGTVFCLANPGCEYVLYLYSQSQNMQHELDVKLKKGAYYYQFYDPKTGAWHGSRQVNSYDYDGFKSFQTPLYDEDVVLYIVEEQYEQNLTPVELSHFSAKVINNAIHLQWHTSSESNNYGFEINMSNDGVNFTTLAFIQGKGTTVDEQIYRFSYQPNRPGYYKFRLKQIDNDGSFHYSEWINVRFAVKNSTQPFAYVLPNPARKHADFHFDLRNPDVIDLRIYNLLGQQILHTRFETQMGGNQRWRWDGKNQSGESAPPGIYFFNITTSRNANSLYPMKGKFILIKP
jgi:hypothetical protein